MLDIFEYKGLMMGEIIPKATPIPYNQTQKFRTLYDNQEKVLIQVYEGDSLYIKDNHLLGEFMIDNLPKKPKGDVILEVNFKIVQNLLHVSVKEISEGKIFKEKDIENNKQMSEKDIKESIKILNRHSSTRLSTKFSEIDNLNGELKDLEKNPDMDENDYEYLSNYSQIIEEMISNLINVI